jgi:pimeloyl-ACP methyl ester carboxylesterase
MPWLPFGRSQPIVALADSPTSPVRVSDRGAQRLESVSETFYLRFPQIKPRNFLLVHGAWHTGACWDTVRYYLTNLGHAVYAPTLYGHGMDVPPRDITFDRIADGVVAGLAERNLTNVCGLGWSFGGPVLQKVIARCPERFGQVIFLNAFVLRDTSILDTFVSSGHSEALGMVHSLVDPTTNAAMMPFDLFAQMLMPAGPGATPQLQKVVYYSLKPESWPTIEEVVTVPEFWAAIKEDPYIPHVRTAYIRALGDVAFGEDFWLQFARLLGPNCPVFEIPGGHEAMYGEPEKLTAAILQAAYFGVPA